MPVLQNAKHELFAHEIAKGSSSRDAYKAAGYETKSDAAADACASRLLSDAKIQGRVAEIKGAISERAIEKTAISKAWIIAKLVENVERALQHEPVRDAQGNPTGEYKYNGNVANRALELLGKTEGMFIDRVEHGAPGEFADLSPEDLKEFILLNAKEIIEADGTGQMLLPAPEKKSRRQSTKH